MRLSQFFFIIAALACFAATARAEPELITAGDIRKIAPFAKDDLIDALIASQDEFEAHGVTTRLRMAHFLAQVMTETGGLKRLDENMNYSFDALMRVFSRKTVSEDDARRIAGKPVEVANWVYGERLGNRGRHTMDGWNYRGSGYIQLTGRANFLARGEEIGIDIASNPALVRDPAVGLTAALAYWSQNDINSAADAHDRLRVRTLVNGPAAHGYSQSKAWFNKVWTGALRDKDLLGFEAETALVADAGMEALQVFDEILEDTGFLDPTSLTLENSGDARREAIMAFQREHGLDITGEIDLETEDFLLDPIQWRAKQVNALDQEGLPEIDPDATVRIDLSTGDVILPEPDGFESNGSGLLLQTPGGASSESPFEGMQTPEELSAILSVATATYPVYAPIDEFPDRNEDGIINYGIIGDDNRYAATKDYETLERPFSSTVHITYMNKYGSEKSCTGAMVGRNAVLTAAHCIHSGTIKGYPYTDLVAIPGWVGGVTNFGECDAVDAMVLGGWITATSLSELHAYDLGLVKLDCGVGDISGWFAMRALGDDETGLGITVQGYASDKSPRAMQWLSTDHIRSLTSSKGFHQADTYGGTSGAPIYETGLANTIIGIHTNTYFGLEEPWKSNNGFTRLTPERLAIIAEWIAE